MVQRGELGMRGAPRLVRLRRAGVKEGAVFEGERVQERGFCRPRAGVTGTAGQAGLGLGAGKEDKHALPLGLCGPSAGVAALGR